MCCSDPLAAVEALKQGGKTAVLVGTPGRLMDMLQRCSFLDTKPLEVTTGLSGSCKTQWCWGASKAAPVPKAPAAASCERCVWADHGNMHILKISSTKNELSKPQCCT